MAGADGLHHRSLADRGRPSIDLSKFADRSRVPWSSPRAHLVMSPGGREPIPFRLFLDGEAPGLSHGVDVDEAPSCDNF